MNTIDLRSFGFPCDFEVHGTVKDCSLEGKRLVFLFAENHRSRQMKRLNVLNACNLFDHGVVGCAGTEIPRAVCCFTLGKTIRRKSKNDGQPTGAQPTQLETANGPAEIPGPFAVSHWARRFAVSPRMTANRPAPNLPSLKQQTALAEIPLDDLNILTQEEIKSKSRELFEEHKTDREVINCLKLRHTWCYGFFEFGNTLKILRPSLAVRCVEDPALREEMKPIANAYCIWELGGGPHPSPDHRNMGDHPHNLKREKAMIDNLLTLWNETAPNMAAILNTGLAHSQRIATELRERGVRYLHLSESVR